MSDNKLEDSKNKMSIFGFLFYR